MKLLHTFKDAASQEIAWFNALTRAKADGFTHVVSVFNGTGCFQKHYFKSMRKAKEFYDMTKQKTKYWTGATKPATINSQLKQLHKLVAHLTKLPY